jgi:hypothetical protein
MVFARYIDGVINKKNKKYLKYFKNIFKTQK